jgi:hypothetical protein
MSNIDSEIQAVYSHCMRGVRTFLKMPHDGFSEEDLEEFREKGKQTLRQDARRLEVIQGFIINEDGDKVWFNPDEIADERAAAVKFFDDLDEDGPTGDWSWISPQVAVFKVKKEEKEG